MSDRERAIERGDLCLGCGEPSCICPGDWDDVSDPDPECMECGLPMDELGIQCGYLTCDVCAHADDL